MSRNPPEPLEALLQPGATLRINLLKIHVRAIVDDDYIVYRQWNGAKRWWDYHVENRHFFALWYENGLLRRVARKEKMQ